MKKLKSGIIVIAALMLAACSEESEQQGGMREEPLMLSAVTRSPAEGISDAGEDISPIQIFLMAGTEKTEGNFVYNTTTKTWMSTIGVKEMSNYIFGFSPATAASGTISTITSGAADYSEGAVLTFDKMNAVGGDDLCVVVGVKWSKEAETPEFGTFKFQKQGNTNYVCLLLDHLFSAINFNIKIGSKYNELRDIRLKKMELQSAQAVSQINVTLKANTTGTNPIANVSYLSAEGPQSNMVYDYGTDDSTTKGLLLTPSGTSFVSYCAPIAGIEHQLKLVCTYDVYNKKGTLVRQNCTAENSLSGMSGVTIGRGRKSTVNLTVEPSYLYQLSDDELDNPGIKIEN